MSKLGDMARSITFDIRWSARETLRKTLANRPQPLYDAFTAEQLIIAAGLLGIGTATAASTVITGKRLVGGRKISLPARFFSGFALACYAAGFAVVADELIMRTWRKEPRSPIDDSQWR